MGKEMRHHGHRGLSQMDEPRMPSGIMPLLAGLALVGLGAQFDIDVLRSVGVAVLVGGMLLLILSRFTSG